MMHVTRGFFMGSKKILPFLCDASKGKLFSLSLLITFFRMYNFQFVN